MGCNLGTSASTQSGCPALSCPVRLPSRLHTEGKEEMASYKDVWRWLASKLGGARSAAHIKAYVLGGCGGRVQRTMVSTDLKPEIESSEGSDSDSSSDSESD